MKKSPLIPLFLPSMLLTVTTRCWTVPPPSVLSIITCKTISLFALWARPCMPSRTVSIQKRPWPRRQTCCAVRVPARMRWGMA